MKRNLTFAVSALAVVLAAAPAHAVPVIDPGNIAQAVKVVQNGVQQLTQLKGQLTEITNVKNTIGQLGKGVAGSLLGDVGLDFKDLTKNPLTEFKQTLPGMLSALPTSETGKKLGISSSLAENATKSIDSGRNFAIQAFYRSTNASVNDVAMRQGVRQAALRDSATAGYALAVYSKNDLNNVEKTMQKLTEGVSNATDLRGDVAANTAVQIATLRQVAVTNQLLAQLLEVSSTTAITQDESGISVGAEK